MLCVSFFCGGWLICSGIFGGGGGVLVDEMHINMNKLMTCIYKFLLALTFFSF